MCILKTPDSTISNTTATSYFEWTEEQPSFEMTSILIMTLSDLEDLGILSSKKQDNFDDLKLTGPFIESCSIKTAIAKSYVFRSCDGIAGERCLGMVPLQHP